MIATRNKEFFELPDVSELIKELLESGSKGVDLVHIYDYDLSLGDQVIKIEAGRGVGRDLLQFNR